jgi:hypothetical protein
MHIGTMNHVRTVSLKINNLRTWFTGEIGRPTESLYHARPPQKPKMVSGKKKPALILAFSPRRRNRCSRVWSI